ncbi:MAG: outer membrane beta-barrel protein [Bacteroidales bacterium]
MKKYILLLFLCITLPLMAQSPGLFSFTLKAGASFGGSQPGKFRQQEAANLMLDFSGGVGLGLHFSSAWQICVDMNYIRKGINCPLRRLETGSTFFKETNNTNVYGWFNNAYLEVPLTFGYTWGYGICRTRIGMFYARRLSTRSKLIIDGDLVEPLDDQYSKVYNLYEQQLSNHDYGIKIANEFYFNDFSIGVEFSTGFVPTIQSQWRASDSQSYTMAIGFYAGYRF